MQASVIRATVETCASERERGRERVVRIRNVDIRASVHAARNEP